MKIVIHGTNGGYNIFTTEKEKMFDARPDSNKKESIGQQAYSIKYTENSIVFSKYKIIRDVVGDKRTGNVAFSIVIPHAKKLSGIVVLTILDKLSNYFCSKHIVNDNLDNFREDWAWVSEIKNEYENNLKYNDDLLVGGSADPAFLFYDSNELLEKYFELPYQEEYNAYKQIFFVQKTLEGKPENPLNALRHDPSANLTGKIDLENPKYKLIYNQQAGDGVKIEVKVNDSLRSTKRKIRRKEDLQIIWSKRFCKTIVKCGKWYEIGSEFLDINHIEMTITVKEKELEPITYNLLIQTKDRFSTSITDAEIRLKINNYLLERKAINNSIQITEEELQNKCYIIAQKDNLISPLREVKLEDTKGSITLILYEHRKVSFYVKDENGLVNNYKIQISNKEVQLKDGNLVFVGEEIEKTWQIFISHRDYETEQFSYCPAKDENTIHKILTKKKVSGQSPSSGKKMFCIKLDETKGRKSDDHCDFVYDFPQFVCLPHYGYKFKKWKKIETKNDAKYDGYYEAVFEEKWYRKIPKSALLIFFILILALFIFIFLYAAFYIIIGESKESSKSSKSINIEIVDEITSYTEDVELNIRTLEDYKRKYCDTTSMYLSDVTDESLWQKLNIFGFEGNSNSTYESSALPDFCSKIDSAIDIRHAINIGKVDELKGYMYSESQKKFKNSIDSIDDKYKKQIGDTLNARIVSGMNLNQVADLILKTQNDLRAKEKPIQKDNKEENETDQDIENKNNIKGQNKSKTLNSGNSLEIDFWNLVNSGNAQMDLYSNLLKIHKNKGGDIITYLKKICKNSDSFNKFKNIDEMDRKSAKKLTDIVID